MFRKAFMALALGFTVLGTSLSAQANMPPNQGPDIYKCSLEALDAVAFVFKTQTGYDLQGLSISSNAESRAYSEIVQVYVVTVQGFGKYLVVTKSPQGQCRVDAIAPLIEAE